MKSKHQNMIERLLTVPELAEWLNISVKTIYRMTARREIPFYRLGSGKKGIRFKLTEILKWLETRKEHPTDIPRLDF